MDFNLLREQIFSVNQAFYDLVYRDAWLKLIFEDVRQEFIEKQQTDFMVGAFGGPKEFSGRGPIEAHPHIYVTEEMWMLREKYLKEAFLSVGFPEDLQARWLKIDEAFKRVIVKKCPDDCRKRYTMDKIIDYPNPESLVKKKAA